MEEKEIEMRLFDTDLFDQEWFGELTPRLKLLYIYILMKCDCAGIIELNMRKFTFDINCQDEPITRKDIFESFGGRIVPLGGNGADDCSKAIVPDFIRFHYGKRLVNDHKHNIHRSVVKRLKSVGLSLEAVCKMASKKFEYDDFGDVVPSASQEQKQGELFQLADGVDSVKVKKTVRKGNSPFVKPTLDEVKAYFKEKGTSIDPEEFWAKYESVGWVDKNGNRIKDWKRCLVTWERFRKKTPSMIQPQVKHADNWRGSVRLAEEANNVL